MKPEIQRFAMSAQERDLRSRAKLILSEAGLLHGTLVVRNRVCGKPGCRCARGEKHRCLFLTFRKDGKFQQLYVPKVLEATVRRWVGQDHAVREILRKISEFHWEKVKKEKQGR